MTIDKDVKIYSGDITQDYKIVRLNNTVTTATQSDVQSNFKGPLFKVKSGGDLTIGDHVTLSGDKGTKTITVTEGTTVCDNDSQYAFKLTPFTSSDMAGLVPNKSHTASDAYTVNIAEFVFRTGTDKYLGRSDSVFDYYTEWDITQHYTNRNENSPRATWVLVARYFGSTGKLDTYYLKNKQTGEILGFDSQYGTDYSDADEAIVKAQLNDTPYVLLSTGDSTTRFRWRKPFIENNELKFLNSVITDYLEIKGLYKIERDYDKCLNGTTGTKTTIKNTITPTTWKSSQLTNNSGYFIHQEGGNVTIDGATFKDFTTFLNSSGGGKGTYDDQPLGVAPIYVAGGKFVMNSGNIVNNTVGYTINDDESDNEAHKIKSYIENKPETYTAGAIIFTGGTDHELNGGFIAGNKADSGAIIVKTKSDHPFARYSSFEGHSELANWAKTQPASTTKVTMGATSDDEDTPVTGPVIAGNVGIHDSGAIFIWPVGDKDTAEVTMNAGTIKDNFSWYKGGAFNVCSEIDPIEHWTRDQKRPTAKAILNMNGGLIENNTAVSRSGAIEVLSDQVYLNAGVLRDNNSRTLGGAIYVEGDFADRLYTLYLPNAFVTENNAWRETKAKEEANDYAYLKRELVSGNRAKQDTDGTYTYDNPLGNISRDSDGRVSEDDKKDWDPTDNPEDKKWILCDSRTGDWAAYGNMGLGGGLWLCAVGGYASINFLNDGAYIDKNYGTKGNGRIDWDITALGRDGGFVLSKENTTANDPSEYVYLDNPSEHLVWNQLYSGNGGGYNLVNEKTGSTDSTSNGENGILITNNNARVGGGIASNGTVIFGESGDINRHSAETTFTKKWTGITARPMAFQAYIIKADGTKVAIPGYQFILDGTKVDVQGGKGTPQSVVTETTTESTKTSVWTAKIELPYGYDGTPTFEMTAKNADGKIERYNTLMPLWDIPSTEKEGKITGWNFAVEEIPSEQHITTGLSTGSEYFLIKKVDETKGGTEYDRDPNFKDANGYTAPIDISAQTEETYTKFKDRLGSGLYFVRKYSGVTEINETLFNGKYIILDENGNKVEDWFTINNNGESEFDSHNLVEKPEKVKLSHTNENVDYKDKEKKTITTIKVNSIKAYTEDEDGLKMENRGRTEAEVEKYIDNKVDKDLATIDQTFKYDIIARVPDQAEEFVISDTLVDWIKYVSNSNEIGIKVLNDNDHLGNGQGTVATGMVNEENVVNDNLTNQIKNKCEKIIFNDTLTVRVTDKELLKALTGKYVQITVEAEIDSDYYGDVISKIGDRKVTYSTGNTGTYKLRNEFDKDKYIYRLYKVVEDGVTPNNMSDWAASTDKLSANEIKALGISSGQKLARTGRLGAPGDGSQAGFVEKDETFYNLSPGKYVLHVMNKSNGDDDGSDANKSKEWTVPELCEVFEIIDGKEDIRWVSVAGGKDTQSSLPEAFKNDSPYMGIQQTAPQVITGEFDDDIKYSYQLKEFDKYKYIYRLYKVVENHNNPPTGMSNWKEPTGEYLSDSELAKLGISSGQPLVRTGRLGTGDASQAGFVENDKTFYNLSKGKYVLHVMDKSEGDDEGTDAQKSKAWTVEDKCIVFELGAADTLNDPEHDGIGNRATYSVTYRGGRQQTLKTNTVTVEPIPGELEFTKIWDGDGAVAPDLNSDEDKAIVDAFTAALTLKLGEDIVDDPGFVIEKTENNNKWKIKTKQLPMYEKKTYTISEDMDKLTGRGASAAVKDFFKDYVVSYSNVITADIVKKALEDASTSTPFHDDTITFKANQSFDRKLLSANKLDEENGGEWKPANGGDTGHINGKYGITPVYWNEATYYHKMGADKETDLSIKLSSLPDGTYFDIRWNGDYIGEESRKYEVINEKNTSSITYSVYKKDANSGNTLGTDLESSGNGLAVRFATDDQKNNYKKVLSKISESDLVSNITPEGEGEYLIVAENTSERIVSMSISQSDNDGKITNGGTIYNTRVSSVELPDTGGVGTKWFYIIGAAAVAGTIIAIVARRSKKKKTDAA